LEYLTPQFERRGITIEIFFSSSKYEEESKWIPIYRNGKLIDQHPEKQRQRIAFDTVYTEALAKM